MKNALRVLMVTMALLALAVPVWAYNSQPSGVAYNDPQFTTMYVTGAARVGGALTVGSTAITSTGTELNTLAGIPATVTSASTASTGAVEVHFTLKNAAGSAISRRFGGIAYLSEADGDQINVLTSAASASYGNISGIATSSYQFTSTSAGKVGVTLTVAAGTYRMGFILPNGAVTLSSTFSAN